MIKHFSISVTTLALAAGWAISAHGQEGGSPKKDWTSQGASALQDQSANSPAEVLYVEKCAMCHRQMGMGTVLLSRRLEPAKAQLEDREDFTEDYVTIVVRRGLGNMPPISRGEVSDEQLEVIAGYLAKETDQ